MEPPRKEILPKVGNHKRVSVKPRMGEKSLKAFPAEERRLAREFSRQAPWKSGRAKAIRTGP